MNRTTAATEPTAHISWRDRLITRLQHPATAWLVLGLSLLVTLIAWFVAGNLARQNAQQQFDVTARDAAKALSERMLDYEQVLRGGVALFNSSNDVTRSEWRNYVTTLQLDRYFPGIQGIGFAQWIPPAALAEHVRTMRTEGFPGYGVRPAGARNGYTAVVYLEPFAGRNLRSFGYDMFSEPVSRTAMERARDTGEPAVSGRVILQQETNSDVQPGFLMYLPVYRDRRTPTSIPERRVALHGYVYAPFRMRDFMHGVLGPGAHNLDLKVYDGTLPTAETLLYDSRPDQSRSSPALFSTTLVLDLSGHRWTLLISSLPSLETELRDREPLLIGTAGILADLLLFVIFLSLSRRHRLAVNQARYANASLRVSRTRLEHAVEASRTGLWDWDLLTNEIYFSPECKQQLGYADHELQNEFSIWESRLHPDDRDRALQAVKDYLHGHSPVFEVEFRLRHREGHYCHILSRGTLHRDDNGKPARLLGSHTDLTSQARLREAMEGLTTLDPHFNPFDVIARSVNIALHTRWCVIGKIDSADSQLHVLGFWDGNTPGTKYSYPLTDIASAETCAQERSLSVTHDIQKRFPNDRLLAEMASVSCRGEALTDNEGRVVGVLFAIDDKPCAEDATERAFLRLAARRAALEILRQEAEQDQVQLTARLYDTLESISDGFFSLNHEWRFTFLNARAAEMFQKSWHDLKGRRIWDELPEIASFFFKPLQEALSVHKSVTVAGMYAPLERWFELTAYPSNDGLSVYFRDITAEKQAEQKRQLIEQRLQGVQKLETIGQLTGGIAHDFNNILASILGFSEIAQRRFAPDRTGKLAEYLENIHQAGERGRDLIQQMMTFARGDTSDNTEPVKLEPLMRNALKLLRPTLPSSLTIRETYTPGLPTVIASASRLHQILSNLCINARDAIQGHGKIEISLRRVLVAEEAICSSCHHVFSGDYMELTVSDNGQGMPSHILGRIFDPFFTTKEPGKGTGMGLAMVHGLTHELGGHLTVTSQLGRGSVFRVLLPVSTETEFHAPPEESEPAIAPQDRRAHIMVVDDESALVNYLRDLLEGCGHTVTAISDPRLARQTLLRSPRCVDLLITDQTMPQLTGLELAMAVRDVRNDLPIIICSGYSDSLHPDVLKRLRIHIVLTKPVSANQLLKEIRTALQTRETTKPATA